MSVDVDVTVTFHCAECRNRCHEDDVAAFCQRCTDAQRAAREKAERQRLLGWLSPAEAELCDRMARDLDDPTVAKPS